MDDELDRGQFFLPAATKAEAITRVYSLTGAPVRGTRGEKGAVLALRDALDLDIETARTNARKGSEVAFALGVEWLPSFEETNTVNLDGLNALLEGATEAYHLGSMRRLAGNKPSGLDDARWAAFQPAPSKIEAVNRISNLTGSGPERLGPGSKEQKSVLINLARNLAPHVDTQLSKTKLGAALAEEFGAPWSAECESTGETISLVGLNTLLAGAELKLGKLGVDRAMLLGTPEQEGKALAAALLDGWRAKKGPDGRKRVLWDARQSISWMERRGLTRGPNDNEWQGFYFEAYGRELLNAAFAPNPNPPRIKYGKTDFDYSLQYVWDLKAHTESWRTPSTGALRAGQSSSPLNDQEAMRTCIEEQGLGFLVLGGVAIEDEDGSFVAWHRARKQAKGVKSSSSNSGRSRMRKAAFEPQHVEAFYFHGLPDLDAAIAAGRITGFNQGKQAPKDAGQMGAARRPKFGLSLGKARSSPLAVARFDWPT
ncbi:hypothetical protein ACRTEC_04230 [Janibacter indicus]